MQVLVGLLCHVDAGVTVSAHMYVHVRVMKESEVDLALVH